MRFAGVVMLHQRVRLQAWRFHTCMMTGARPVQTVIDPCMAQTTMRCFYTRHGNKLMSQPGHHCHTDGSHKEEH